MKIKTITLPFLSMQEGEDQTPEQPIKTRNDLFIEGLGLSEQVKESLMNNETTIDEVVESFQGSYNDLLKATHQTNWDEERKNAGISDGLIRISVGLESVDDIKADIEKGL